MHKLKGNRLQELQEIGYAGIARNYIVIAYYIIQFIFCRSFVTIIRFYRLCSF